MNKSLRQNGDDGFGTEHAITLGLLDAVHNNSRLTQRSAAQDLGIALGLANAYLKRCIKKGWIKVSQIPPNRYAYYLTPKGFAEKSRLTGEYLSQSFQFFREARNQCADLLGQCHAAGWERIALAGVGDLSEIATLCARDYPLTLAGIVAPDYSEERTFAGLPVVPELDALGPVDAVIVSDLASPQETFDAFAALMPRDRVLAPPLLGVAEVLPGFEDE